MFLNNTKLVRPGIILAKLYRNINKAEKFPKSPVFLFPGADSSSAAHQKIYERSYQELLAMYNAPLILGIPVVHVMIFMIIPNGPNFLYQYIPHPHRALLTLVLCAVFEFYVLTLWLSIGVLFVFILMLCFYTVIQKIDGGMEMIRDCKVKHFGEATTLMKVYKNLRNIQLLLQEFNNSSEYMIFGEKMLLLYESIFLGSAGIHLLSEHIVLGIMFSILTTVPTLTYLSIFGRAFRIPCKMQELKGAMKESAGQYLKGFEKGMVMKSVDSIRCVGIRSGQFNYIERVSALLFIDFVTRTIVQLLLTA
ncbi:unnamed protein product [Allacma fusca]|uniref:Uncharacterized protein n=1 Tax=Allacma fusca TaxID=39272 RepID=A0A8J2NV08_9HEXA|nr:unnamed protein product [Allacma fusca]